MKTHNSIADVLSYHLGKYNSEHPGIRRRTEDSVIDNIRNAIRSRNEVLDNVEISVNGVPVDRAVFDAEKIALPDAFRQKPVTYTAVAEFRYADGELARSTAFGIEVTN